MKEKITVTLTFDTDVEYWRAVVDDYPEASYVSANPEYALKMCLQILVRAVKANRVTAPELVLAASKMKSLGRGHESKGTV